MSLRLGLRARITAALLGISALALATAAVALLVPLQALLRHDTVALLTADARTARPQLDAALAQSGPAHSPALDRAVHDLGRRMAAQVVVLTASGRILAANDVRAGDRFADVTRAIHEHRTLKATAEEDEQTRAQIAVPLEAGGRAYGLAVRRSLKDLGAARAAVERAVGAAAIFALAVALAVGSGLAGRLTRRLSALRDTSLRLGALGPLVEVHDDGTQDEIGDLTRAFVTMQQHLRAQEQARRTFVATASHELRTPLSSLRLMLHSASDELRRPHPDLTDTREQLDRALIQTERLSALAADLLDLSRLDAGGVVRSENVELAELARSVIAEFEPRTPRSGPTIVLAGADARWACADPGGVAQVLRILLDNASRHAPSTEPIRVQIGTADARAAITVSDAGPGVPAADAERIFGRFQRGADSAGAGGFGLGLAIARELAHRMGGELTLCASPAGARFRLSLTPASLPVEDESASLAV